MPYIWHDCTISLHAKLIQYINRKSQSRSKECAGNHSNGAIVASRLSAKWVRPVGTRPGYCPNPYPDLRG